MMGTLTFAGWGRLDEQMTDIEHHASFDSFFLFILLFFLHHFDLHFLLLSFMYTQHFLVPSSFILLCCNCYHDNHVIGQKSRNKNNRSFQIKKKKKDNAMAPHCVWADGGIGPEEPEELTSGSGLASSGSRLGCRYILSSICLTV